MDDKEKKTAQEESPKDEKVEMTEEEAEKAAGGASFGFYDREKRRPK